MKKLTRKERFLKKAKELGIDTTGLTTMGLEMAIDNKLGRPTMRHGMPVRAKNS